MLTPVPTLWLASRTSARCAVVGPCALHIGHAYAKGLQRKHMRSVETSTVEVRARERVGSDVLPLHAQSGTGDRMEQWVSGSRGVARACGYRR